jgi:prophage regulatory protein
MSNANTPGSRQAANTPSEQIDLLRLPVVLKRRGRSRSSHYADIKAGLFVKPVLIGLRAKATPHNELDALNAARVAGKSDAEIRALVVKLEAARKTAA